MQKSLEREEFIQTYKAVREDGSGRPYTVFPDALVRLPGLNHIEKHVLARLVREGIDGATDDYVAVAEIATQRLAEVLGLGDQVVYRALRRLKAGGHVVSTPRPGYPSVWAVPFNPDWMVL